MPKFFGIIGYAETKEIDPGIWDDIVTERKYYGDVVRDTRKLEEGVSLNNDISIGNSFSIMADDYAMENFYAMRFLEWRGSLWMISNIEMKAPRLLLRVGGLYNGPRATIEVPHTP